RRALNTSWTTAIAALSTLLTSLDWVRRRGRYACVTRRIGGDIARARSVNCQSIRIITYIIEMSVTAAPTDGMNPSMTRYRIAWASFWMRYTESAVPTES